LLYLLHPCSRPDKIVEPSSGTIQFLVNDLNYLLVKGIKPGTSSLYFSYSPGWAFIRSRSSYLVPMST